MGKIIFEFDMFDDKDNITIHNMAWGMWNTLWDFDQSLRNKIKYSPDDQPENELLILETIREELRELLDTYNVHLDNVD